MTEFRATISFVPLSAEPNVPGHIVSTYATLTTPAKMCFDQSGNLYVGRDVSSGRIYKVEPGGGAAVPFGDADLDDPDAVYFDEDGVVAGTPGSILVGGRSNDNTSYGYIAAIAPDETTSTVFGPTTDYVNPSNFERDSTGRILFVDPHTESVLATEGETPTKLFDTEYRSGAITVDSSDRIFVATWEDAVIRIYSSDGTLLDDAFVTGLGTSVSNAGIGLAIGPGDGAWGEDLYVFAGGKLLRVDMQGNVTVLGTEFAGGSGGDLVFGPDHALYISEYGANRILRVMPDLQVNLQMSVVNQLWGSVDVDPYQPGYDYQFGSGITLNAAPIEGKAFSHWELYDPNHPGDANYVTIDSNNPITISMFDDREVTAVFKCGSGAGPLLPLGLGLIAVFAVLRRRR